MSSLVLLIVTVIGSAEGFWSVVIAPLITWEEFFDYQLRKRKWFDIVSKKQQWC